MLILFDKIINHFLRYSGHFLPYPFKFFKQAVAYHRMQRGVLPNSYHLNFIFHIHLLDKRGIDSIFNRFFAPYLRYTWFD